MKQCAHTLGLAMMGSSDCILFSGLTFSVSDVYDQRNVNKQ